MAKDEEIQATAWTLRFKHGKHTILLFAEPLTPFNTIKTELLTVLRDRYPNGLPLASSTSEVNIPDSIHEVMLGVPIDIYEPSKGWTELNTSEGGIRESPMSLGLKDGATIAFAFFPEGEGDENGAEFVVEWSSYEDNFDMENGEEE